MIIIAPSTMTLDRQEYIRTQGSITACPDCDLLLSGVGHVLPKTTLKCPRCHCILLKPKHNTITRTLALSLTGLLLYFPAMFLPLLTFKTLGMSESGSVLSSIFSFFLQDYYVTASISLLAVLVLPFVKLSLLAGITYSVKIKHYSPQLPTLFRFYLHLDEWGMLEVYLIGILITIIKMSPTVEILYGPGFFFFIGLVLLTLKSSLALDKNYIWTCLERQKNKDVDHATSTTTELFIKDGQPLSALKWGYTLCPGCHKLLPLPKKATSIAQCSRCHASSSPRIPNSLSKTWALVLTSILLFIPANTLPIMHVQFLGIPENSTILDGIEYFFKEGSYGIGIIIFTASILVPLFKIVGLLIILLSIQFKRGRYLRQKARMFRLIEFIGRWSMLDIFVIALLGSLVNFGLFTTITAAPAATYFCFVVISTMFAAITFDPRLMWDTLTQRK